MKSWRNEIWKESIPKAGFCATKDVYKRQEYDLPISVEECCEWIRSRELDYLEQGVELKKGARNLLVYLKKNSFKILLATSSYKERAVKMLELTGIEEF